MNDAFQQSRERIAIEGNEMSATALVVHAWRRTEWRRILHSALAIGLVSFVFAPGALAQNAEWAIWVMRPDGGDARMLAQVKGCKQHSGPRWSHDGKHIVFDATPGSASQSSIYVVNADGSGLKKIGAHARAAWSPDDNQIALERFVRPREIHVQNLDGKGRTRISEGSSPRWSPDGSRLAFTDHDNVHVTDLVTGETHAIFRNRAETIYYGFSWFPDGKRLAVVARPKARQPRQLLFVNAEGEEHRIEVRLTGEMGGFNSFSPDGKKLTYSNAYKIHIVEVDGASKHVQLKGQQGANRDPDWSPDGQWIVFTSSRDPM